jgi:hypothetical protein
MSTVLREQGIVTVHDQVVSWVAQRWAKAFHCKVTIHTSLEENPWADPQQQCDIVGWQVSSAGNTMQWMAEVETDDSIKNVATVSEWKDTIVQGIPFYLLVPRGRGRVCSCERYLRVHVCEWRMSGALTGTCSTRLTHQSSI